jgi:hypothetical protein
MSPHHNSKLLFFKQEEALRKQIPHTMKKSIVEGLNSKKKAYDMVS